MGTYAHRLKVIRDVRLDPFKLRLCVLKVRGLDTESNILLSLKAVVTFGKLRLQNAGILFADIIEVISLIRDIDRLLHLRYIRILAHA